MSQTKTERIKKRQLGQFYTPAPVARRWVESLDLTPESTVLEPSAGNGAFVLPLLERFMSLHHGTKSERLRKSLCENIFSVEIDAAAHKAMLATIEKTWGPLPASHNLICGDFFVTDFDAPYSTEMLFGDIRKFDFIIGNPPFGATIEPMIQDRLDGCYGVRDGYKIKKESYSFFIVRCVEMLKQAGKLCFICSDTFLTIPTMKGLREFLLNRGQTSVVSMHGQFQETSQPMVLLDFQRTGLTESLEIEGRILHRDTINLTGNRSWQISEALGHLFEGPKLGDMMIASSGMTVGRNDLFIREILDGTVIETKEFKFRQEQVTLRRELERARLGYLSEAQKIKIMTQESQGATRRTIDVVALDIPRRVKLPHPDYCPYNKSCSDILFAPPRYAIYWRDDGDAVITFKKNGNWYLHGVGGQPYFKREGLSWQLIAPTLNVRYLPPGYILDSGAPCAFLREGIAPDELWFILGWCLAPLCTRILKDVLNHTRNIQSKDFERLPYPFWVSKEKKAKATCYCRELVELAMRSSKKFRRTDREVVRLVEFYALPD